jgi:hypothetical protein
MNVEEVKLYGRKVGELIDGILYISRRKQSKHLYRGGAPSVSAAKKGKTAAWGIDDNILSLLKFRNVKLIAISDTETKKTYYASIGKFDSPDIKYLNFGYGIQRFLNLEHWKQGEFGKIVEALGKIERK